ncbi:hypothetical protein [Streptomyces sp. NPDC047000]|uniref:hypothetical protein n=1 Tax=Streptomyces sp. NPDC047000 TaxID=3155474 RepID=UPI0033D8C1B9
MQEYDLHHLRSADLRREAEQHRLAREAVRGRRAARAEDASRAAEDADDSRRRRWFRTPRAV